DPVLLTIGVASSVHFVESWRTGLAEGLDPVAAADRARRRQRAPLLLATGTTMVGLLSMATSRTPAVVDFGIRAAFGIALLHALLFVLLPRWLAVQRPLAIPTAGDAAGRWFHWLITRRTALSAGAVAVSVLAFAGLPRLAADNDPLDLLPPREPCLVAFDELAAHLGGVEVFHVLVPPESPATDLTRLLPFLGGLQTLPGIVGPAGPLLRGADGALAAPVLLAPGGSAEREQLFDGIERAASVLGLDGTAPVGSAVQIARDSQRLLAGLAGSTVLAIVLLGVGICIGLRSVRLGIVGIVPMVVACAWIYGAIAWLEHPVSVATAMIGCTMLGLIVDNALHLLHSYRHARSGLSPARAAVASLAAVGRPVWVSSFLLIVGFSAAATSRLSSTVEFALLACSTIAVAAFGCLVLLPLLLVAAPDRPGVADAV
ncbi:MAG: hypothetical protein KDE27_01615, partial [Planctomycetes bacterium]|nr:hypothetical protein [Planctomycetota bacterium]